MKYKILNTINDLPLSVRELVKIKWRYIGSIIAPNGLFKIDCYLNGNNKWRKDIWRYNNGSTAVEFIPNV